jgi:hypothetical protein
VSLPGREPSHSADAVALLTQQSASSTLKGRPAKLHHAAANVDREDNHANIPPKRNREQSDLLQFVSLPRSQPSQRLFNGIKQCRRLATRYDRLAANYLDLRSARVNRILEQVENWVNACCFVFYASL